MKNINTALTEVDASDDAILGRGFRFLNNYMKYDPKESYEHLLAKKLLGMWLSDEDSKNIFCNVAQFSWHSNYGVFEELKFYETSSPFYFENSKGVFPDVTNSKYLNWFDETIDRGKILFVPDITVFHKGSPRYIFEVVYTNPVSPRKQARMYKFFRGNYIEVYEINSSDILKNDSVKGVPGFIPSKRII